MQISYEQLVQAVASAVVKELTRRGVEVTGLPEAATSPRPSASTGSVAIDFAGYKTPVLAERQVRAVAAGTAEIVVPRGTICTEGAKVLMQKRKIRLTITQ